MTDQMVPPSRPRDVMVTLRVTEEERTVVNIEAEERGLKPAELMRMAIASFCDLHWQDFGRVK